MIAAQIYFILDKVVHSQYVCSDKLGRENHGVDKLTGSAINKFMHSANFFDFGKSTESKGSYLNSSLFDYKMRWGQLVCVHQQSNIISKRLNEYY